MEIITKSDKETFEFAKDYASKLKGGEVIGLIGDLGAGKTVFSQGLAKGLGIKKPITSPTFVVMKVYPVKHTTIKQFCHIDAYRLTSGADLEAIGALDYFNDPKCVSVVEWADRVEGVLPKSKKIFNLKISKNRRIISYSSL